MAKLGLQFTWKFLVILALGLIHFPNPSESGTEGEGKPLQLHRSSCLGVENERTEFNKDYGGYRRTIGSGLFKKVNPDAWKFYGETEQRGSWFVFQANGRYREPLQVELYGIKVDGRLLNGWFHVVVKHVGPTVRNFEILQMHGVVDYYLNYNNQNLHEVNEYIRTPELGKGGFGEFVHDFPSCTDSEHKDDLKPKKYQFMPCGGLPERGQTMPWGFEYVHPAEGTDSDDLVPSGEHREFHMNFRFSTQPCSHPKKIRFGVTAYLDGGTGITSEIASNSYYQPDHRWRIGASDEIILEDSHVVGAADPVPRPGTYSTLDCSTRIDSHSTSKSKYVAKVLPTNNDRIQTLFKFACTEAETKEFYGKDSPGETALFGGRCSLDDYLVFDDGTSDRASTTRINECRPDKDQKASKDPSTGNTAVEYNEHVANITKNIASLCAPCPTVPPRPVTTERTKPTDTPSPRPTGAPKDDFTMEELAELKRGVELTGSMALEIWDTRLLHGVCMTILSIFVSPINIFVTRYFKETFMDTRIMFLRLWYFVHHSAIVASAILYGAGLWRVVSRRVLAGVNLSLSARVHRSLGWTSIAIVILLALLGGFRPIERKLRTYVIAAHWTLGMTIYFMNYALMINSAWIPASPSAWVENSDNSLGKLVVPVLVIVWILFDVVMHVLMTIHVCNMDKRLGLTRPRYWLPVPISVLPEDETRDLIGSSHRKKMLIVYGVVALVVTVVICCLLGTSDPNDRGLGYMSCTHIGHAKYWQETGKKRC